MRDLGQRTVQRILRSRVLPLLTALLLFTGLVSIAGYLLWQTRIRQEISIVGELSVQRAEPEMREGYVSTKPVVLKIHEGEDVSFLAEGDALQLKMAGSDQEIFLGAKVIRMDAGGLFREMVLAPEGAVSKNAIDKLFRGQPGKAGPTKMTLVVRKQRLLAAALQRGRFN